MLLQGFDELLPPEQREANKGESSFIPQHLRSEIDTFNAFVYENVNNGVYKTGFASSQKAYDEHITKLFQALDRIEYHLAEADNQPYLFGQYITEADIRLFTTLIRFDVSYYTLFKCNLKMIRMDYPRLHLWLRRLYWNDGPETGGGLFRKTTCFETVSMMRYVVDVANAR
jgi:putative glutathione S-transferase